jgi:hypothetical protein
LLLPPLSFAQLRTFQRVEVNAMPVWRDRAGNYGLLIGAVAGAFAGWAVHNARSSNATRRPKLGEDMAECASLGSLAGFLTARFVVARPRWRPVTLP